jgi:hypothetical protein
MAVRLAICGHHYRKICELHGLCSNDADSETSPAFSMSFDAAALEQGAAYAGTSIRP